MPYGQINWTGPSPVGGNPGNSGGLLLSRLFGMGGGGGGQMPNDPMVGRSLAQLFGMGGGGGNYQLPQQQFGAPGGWGGGQNWGGGMERGPQPAPWSGGGMGLSSTMPVMNFGFGGGGGIGFGQPLPMANGGGFANPVTLPARPDLSLVQPNPGPAAPQPAGIGAGVPQQPRPQQGGSPGRMGTPQFQRRVDAQAAELAMEGMSPVQRNMYRRRYGL